MTRPIENIQAEIQEAARHPALYWGAAHEPHLSAEQLRDRASAGTRLEALQAERAVIVRRVGAKISRVREHMVADGKALEFLVWRFSRSRRWGNRAEVLRAEAQVGQLHVAGFEPGGCYAQPEGRREAFVDAMLAALEIE